MSLYDFSALNDKDLEILASDLLSRELSIHLQSFKVGRDKGIDLRYATTSNENEIVVQVKHYIKSGYHQLFHSLKNIEKPKVALLRPNRYILVTSIELSPLDKSKIKEALEPYIQNTNDIIGKDDLNAMISRHIDVETKHFKLWFSNTLIIQKIINNGIEGRSAFIAEKIKRTIELFVVNESFEKAIEILRKEKILLIIGIPGIGKTTLANIITFSLLSKDFRLVYIDALIKDAEDMFDSDPKAKQLFFFDDFLGSTYLEILNCRNTDKSISNFIERIRVTPNKYLILTTRTTILNQAKSIHDNLNRANIENSKYELEISKYTKLDKARILYNHLYSYDLAPNFIQQIFLDKRYYDIINHTNYSPRLIEFFTLEHNISHLQADEYFNFIMQHLNNPSQIWATAITNQLSEEEKLLLFTLLSMGRNTSKVKLEEAFEERMTNEISKHGFQRKINIFNISFKNLLEGYISNTYYSIYRISYINFVNPSIQDYLIHYFNLNDGEKWRLIDAFIYVEQFVTSFTNKDQREDLILIRKNEAKKFIEVMNSKNLKSIYEYDSNNAIQIGYLKIYTNYKDEKINSYLYPYITEKLEKFNWADIKSTSLEDLLFVLLNIDLDSQPYFFVKTNHNNIFDNIINKINEERHLKKVKQLFEYFDISFEEYKEEDECYTLLQGAVDRIYAKEANEMIEQKKYEILNKSDFEDLKDDVERIYWTLSSAYLYNPTSEASYDAFKTIDMEELIAQNQDADDNFDVGTAYDYNEDMLIDELFEMFEK